MDGPFTSILMCFALSQINASIQGSPFENLDYCSHQCHQIRQSTVNMATFDASLRLRPKSESCDLGILGKILNWKKHYF